MERENYETIDLVSEIKVEKEEIHVDFIKTEERDFVSPESMTGTGIEVKTKIDPDLIEEFREIEENTSIKQEPVVIHKFEITEITEEEAPEVQDSFLPEPEQSGSLGKQFVCIYCHNKLVNKNSLRVHLNSYHRGFPHEYTGGIIQCKFCQEVCGDFETLKKHVLENHPAPPPKSDLKYECAHCGKRIGKLYYLRRHMVTHSNERPHQCPICLKTFKSLNQRNYHQKTVHATENLFQCPECPKNYKSRKHLNSHRQVHNVGLNFKCTECEKSFQTKGELRSHIASHNDAKFPCKVCGKVFKSSLRRYEHFNYLHKPPEERKSFDCSVCSKSFRTNSKLRNHAFTHTAEKPFKCQICPKEAEKEISFRSRNGLNSHMNSVHYSKTFTCSVCSKTYSSSFNLYYHMRYVHSDKKPKKSHKCTICQKDLERLSELKDHMLKFHGNC